MRLISIYIFDLFCLKTVAKLIISCNIRELFMDLLINLQTKQH